MTDKLLVDRELLERVLNASWGSETVNALDDLRDFLASAPSPANHVEDVRAMVAAPRQPEGDASLDERMKAAGMLSVAELLAGAPLDAFMKHAGVNDLATFAEWLEMRRAGCIRMHARYDLGERDKGDDLYEWTIAHSAVFNEVHVNFKAASADAQRAIAELREECGRVKSENDHLARHINKMITERDTLRQQLAERDATIERLEAGIPRIQEQSHQMRQQRDKLVGLLGECRGMVAHEVERWTRAAAILPVNANVESGLLTRIDAALAEVK